ncbi:uracil-5--methyltransferase TRM9 [Morchella conica CCBAS932]|uniref:Uracil-5--methyltransferase TRM9 n=1 Tax=Morchella conica CCBAS932 TaxID=1392247 RepID=A0A3N4L1Q3_9PEZI|nr:uracil-5--methyltransferase TRM9 [Morchella conica CCBAS932]
MDINNPQNYEAEHVHRVYELIASHFSATRFKPWPIVEGFLKGLPIGSIGLDLGCGNGKYLTVNENVFMIGSDRSTALVQIAHDLKTQDSLIADTLELPHPDSRFDFAISIAVIHHFSTTARRIASIRSILATLKPSSNSETNGGKALIYVWALEQPNSKRGWKEGDPQDVMVPWQTSEGYSGVKGGSGKLSKGDKVVTYQRYYHLYREGELVQDIVAAGGIVLESGYERDNWWAICAPPHR